MKIRDGMMGCTEGTDDGRVDCMCKDSLERSMSTIGIILRRIRMIMCNKITFCSIFLLNFGNIECFHLFLTNQFLIFSIIFMKKPMV